MSDPKSQTTTRPLTDEQWMHWQKLVSDEIDRQSAEIERLRVALGTVERMANEGRDDAIDNRGHVIELYEARQFEEIGAFIRATVKELVHD